MKKNFRSFGKKRFEYEFRFNLIIILNKFIKENQFLQDFYPTIDSADMINSICIQKQGRRRKEKTKTNAFFYRSESE